MNDAQKIPGTDTLPRAKLRRRWHFPAMWIVPLAAALVAGYLVYDQVREFGPAITIRFKDGSGLRPGRTPILYNGVRVGEVRDVKLSEDLREVVVEASLLRSATALARDGSVFWIVRLGSELRDIANLGTVITGAYIQVRPGSGKEKSDFIGAESTPAALEPGGIEVVLRTNHLGSIKPGSPVYYRGVEVGAVRTIQLSANATAADVHALIRPRYVKLVRGGSKFWNASGVDVKGGLFGGVEINVESLRSLVTGGIIFATPSAQSAPAKNGAVFQLYEEPDRDWLTWAPQISIAPEKTADPQRKQNI